MTLSESLSQMRALAKLWMSEGSVHQRELGGYLTVVCAAAERAPFSTSDMSVKVIEGATEALPPDDELERLTAPDADKESDHE